MRRLRVRIAEEVAIQAGKLSVFVDDFQFHNLLSDTPRAMIHKAVLSTEEEHCIDASDNVPQVRVTQFKTRQVGHHQSSSYRSTNRVSPTKGE